MNKYTKYILVGGLPRSGTTLIETIIGSHSRISLPPGDYPMAEKYTQGKSVEQFFQFQSALSTWRRYEFKDFSSVYNLPYAQAFIESVGLYARELDKDIPAAKSPGNEFFYEIYQQWLKEFDFRFVHMVRNPFDVAASWMQSHIHSNVRNFSDAAEITARNWHCSVSMGLARACRHPDRYHVVKYEELIEKPQAVTERLCSFLGVEFEAERMLSHEDFPYYESNTSFPDDATDKSDDTEVFRTTSRKKYLDPKDIEKIASICGGLANAMDYVDEDFRSYRLEKLQRRKLNNKISRIVNRIYNKSKKVLAAGA